MTHTKIALGISFILWIFFFLAVFFIPLPAPIEEKKEFGEVSIRLDPLPAKETPLPSATIARPAIEQINTEQAAPISEPVASAPSSTATQSTVPSTPSTPEDVPVEPATPQPPPKNTAPVEPATPKPKPKNTTPVEPTTPQPPQTQPQQILSQSIDERIAEQEATSQSKPEAVWDDNLFSDSVTTSSSSSEPNSSPTNSRENSSSLSGVAASTSTNSSSDGTVAEGKRARQSSNENNTASDDTIAALGNIGTIGEGNEGSSSPSERDGAITTTNDSVQGNPSGFAISFTGENRKLLRPAVPTLTISPENEKLIDSFRQLTISFSVDTNGNVSPSNISFTPSAFLPPAIQSELREQISRWQFEPGSSGGQATFIYSINKG